MFEMSQLRCFVALAEELNFRRAAARLNMTQPPLSRQIQLLERHLGVCLMERSTHVVGLTAAGQAFLPEASRILRIAEDALFSARRVAKGENGKLTIGFTSSSGYSVLPQVVRAMRRIAPNISLTMKELVSTAQVEALNAGGIDIGIMRPHAINPELEMSHLATEALLLAIPEHEAGQWPVSPTLACLHGKPFIMYSPYEARPFHVMLNDRFAKANVIPDIVEQVGQVHTMLALVSAGIGVALIAEGAAQLNFANVVMRQMQTEPVEMVCAFRRDNQNPLLNVFKRSVLPAVLS